MMKMTLALVASVAGLTLGAAQPLVDTDEVFPAEYVEDFELDGNLAKDVWKKAEVLPGQRVGGGKALPYKDEIRLLYSRTALYVGATLWQDLSKANFKWDQRDMPTWGDDNLELDLFLTLENGNNGVYQFIINPLGTVADLLDGNINYSNDGIETKAVRLGDRWILEYRIPFAGLPMDRPIAGDFIGARFCRWLHDGKTRYTSASPYLIAAGNEQRGRFAKLLFRAPTGPGAEKTIAEDRTYRTDLVRRRFYKRFDAFRKRFNEIRTGSEYFADSSHPLHRTVRGEVLKMAETFEAFQSRWAQELKAEKPVDEAAAATFLTAADAFCKYASEHAYAVWTADPWSFGAESDLPAADAPEMPAKISFEQAGNEREQVCLEITGLLCGSRLDLRLWPESIGTAGYVFSPKGQYLSSDSVEVYTEPFVQIEGETVTMPLVRADDNLVTVTPGRTVRVWIVFNSRGVPADTYRTTLKFKPANDLRVARRELPMEAKVWSFTLPETHDWPLKSFFWGSYSFNNDEADALEMAWENHITHGWSQLHRYQYGLTRERHVWWSANKGKAKRNPDHDFDDEVALHGNQKFLEKALELRMRFVIGWSTPSSMDWFKLMTKRLLDMGFTYDDFVYKGLLRDEFVKADIPASAKRREEVWGWNTNIQFQATLLSTPPPTGATVQEMIDAKLPEFFTQWTVIRGIFHDPVRSAETIKMIRDAGKQVWSYNCSHFMHKQDIRSYYRLYPWECWLKRLDGVAIWTFGPAATDGWDSQDGFDDGICWRGTDRKCVPTKHLAAFREGLEDVAYMDFLEKALKSEKAKGKDHPEYEKLLTDRNAIVKSNDQAKIDAWRLAAGRAVDELSR